MNATNVVANVALLIVYYAAGRFGLVFFGLIHPSASAVWLPTGIALAALMLGGLRLVPAVFVGAFLVNVSTDGAIWSSLAIAVGNTLEGVLAVTLVERFVGGRDAFASAAGILKFTSLAALLSTTVSATIGVASLALAGSASEGLAAIWLTWWLGDAAGAVLVTPLVVLWWTNRSLRWSRDTVEDLAVFSLAIVVTGALTFFHPGLAQYPLAFLCLAPLVWGALRFTPREIATAIAVLGVIATAATATGRGPLAALTPNEGLLVLQAFLILTSITALPMAALTVERRALLERERAARADADAALRAKDEFLAALSHELRNPLGAITTAAAALDSSAQTRATSAPLVASIRRQAHHLARLFDDLLDMSRLTANKLTLRKEPLDLAVSVARCVDTLVALRGLREDRIQLALEPAWVDADPVRVTQILENLLDNALRHTPLTKRVRVTVRAVEGFGELCVADEGAGIAPALLPRVFDAFTQGPQGLDRSAGGLGLGLTLVRRFAEMHGGTIEAYSPGVAGGSVFTLRLPSTVAPVEAALVSTRSDETAGRPRRLLVVEDNEGARHSLRALLELLGHDVYEAGDGKEAVAAALEVRPDLVFVDIGLPLFDGYEVARRIRSAKLDARLVALTGYGSGDDIRRAREAGFDQHLLKPATLDQLRAAIAAVSAV